MTTIEELGNRTMDLTPTPGLQEAINIESIELEIRNIDSLGSAQYSEKWSARRCILNCKLAQAKVRLRNIA